MNDLTIQLIWKKIKTFPRNTKEYWNKLSKKEKKDFIKFEYGIIIGSIFWIVINLIFKILTFFSQIFTSITIIIIYMFAKLIGFDNPDRIINFFIFADSSHETHLVVREGTDLFQDLLLTFLEICFFIPKFLHTLFSVNFPVLMDINIDIDWLHVDFSYIVRTILNLLQFVILFYITRKIRRKIRIKVKKKIEQGKYIWFPDPSLNRSLKNSE